MKKKLLGVMAMSMAVMGAQNVKAQTDVTAEYLVNPSFESNVEYDLSSEVSLGTNPARIGNVTDWQDNGSVLEWSASAVFAYGTSAKLNGNNIPSSAPEGGENNGLGITVGWGGQIVYKQDVTFPAGVYRLECVGYNINSAATQINSLFGFVSDNVTVMSSKKSYSFGVWEEDALEFTLNSETSGYVQIGTKPVSGGSGANAAIIFDNIKLLRFESQLSMLKQKAEGAKVYLNSAMDAEVKSALGSLIDEILAYESNISSEEIEAADTRLSESVQKVTASIAYYETFKSKFDKAKAYVSERVAVLDVSYNKDAYESAIAAVETRYNNGTLGDADEEVMNVYKALSAAAASQEYKAGVDYSYAILNNSFETGDLTGWELPNGKSSDTGVFNPEGNYKTDGADGNYIFNTWWQGVPMTQTVEGLPEGKYTLSLLYTGESPQISGFYVVTNGVPSEKFTTATTGTFQEVSTVATVGEDGKLVIRVQASTETGEYDENNFHYWYKADNFRLTPVVETVNVSVTDAGWATMMLPFAAEVPAGMKVYNCGAVDEDNILTLNEVSTIEANVPYIVAGEQKEYTFTGANIAKENTYTAGLLTGVYAETQAPVGSYVLQNQTDGVAFYKVADVQPTVKANRAYLTLKEEAGVNVRAVYFPNGDADGVESVDAADVVVDVYTMSGIRVRSNVKKSEALNGLKGVYILKAVK